jgi:hypothetical protein
MPRRDGIEAEVPSRSATMLHMLTDAMVENRLNALEREVADLKQRVAATRTESKWIERVTGSMKDEPDFSQVLELGRAARAADTDNQQS